MAVVRQPAKRYCCVFVNSVLTYQKKMEHENEANLGDIPCMHEGDNDENEEIDGTYDAFDHTIILAAHYFAL